MEEIIKLGRTDTMTSLEIAEITNKQHKDVMRSIRNMEVAWEKVNGRKFALVNYTDQKGEKRPCYQLTKTECLYIATKFNDEARAKLVLRWGELEKKEQYQVPQSFAEALMLAAKQQEKIEQQQLALESKNEEICSSRLQSQRCSQRLVMLIQSFRARRPLQRHRLLKTTVNQQRRSISC